MTSSSSNPRTKKNTGATVIANWTTQNENIYIDIMVEHVKLGHLQTSTFTKHAWKEIHAEFHTKTGQLYDPKQFRNKFNKLRTRCRQFDDLINQTGFGWDPVTLKLRDHQMVIIPEVNLTPGSRAMPLLGLGTATYPFAPEETKLSIVQAIELGYCHFDTASLYESEEPLGEAIAEAQRLGLIKSRDELFVTSKLWCDDAHRDLVLPALHKTLRNLKLKYLDLYLIHFPFSSKPGTCRLPINRKDVLPMDLKSVWESMETCQSLGLTKSIGVSNFTCNKLEELLALATIPPAVNQVEMNPVWQQKKLREFCKEKGIHVTAYSPLGGQDHPQNFNMVIRSEVLKDIANARGKTLAQISLRWLYEQGVSIVAKSFNKNRMKENLQIFDWKLNDEDRHKISLIPQSKKVILNSMLSGEGSCDSLIKSLEEDM